MLMSDRNMGLKSFELYFNLVKVPGRQTKDNMFIIFKMRSKSFFFLLLSKNLNIKFLAVFRLLPMHFESGFNAL